MQKKEEIKHRQQSANYDEIFDIIGGDEAARTLKKIKNKNRIILLSVFLTVLSLIVGYCFVDVYNRDYIGGNILTLPLGNNTEMPLVGNVGSPWKNASFTVQLCFQSLFQTDGTFTEVNPALCSHYQISDDGLTYTITLKEGLQWSDGMPITTDDVVFSFEAFLSCTDVNVNMSTAFNKIAGIEAWRAGETASIEGITVRGNDISIRLDDKYNTFLMMLTQFQPMPKHILEHTDLSISSTNVEFFAKPVVSGMYMTDGIENGNMIYYRNPYYNGEAPQIDEVHLRWDHKTLDLDYYSTTSISEMVDYRAMKGYDEYSVDVFFYRYFVFNLENEFGEINEAFSDVRVRQAIVHAIDAEELLNTVYFNTGSLVYSGSTATSEPVYRYSPSDAIKLLNEAGYDFDRPIVITYYYSDINSMVFLNKVKGYLENIGLKVELIQSTGAAFLYDTKEYDMMLKGLSSFNSEDWYNEYLSTNANFDGLFGVKGEFDSVVDRLNSAVTTKEYNEALAEAIDLELDLLYKFPLFSLKQFTYINANRVFVPEDIVFGNTRYCSDLRFSEWYIKKE